MVTSAADSAADGTLSLGQRIVQRLRRREENREGLDSAVRDLAEAPDDPDFQAVLRARIKRALLEDPELTRDLASLLPVSGAAFTASGRGAVAVQHNVGVISTGGDSTIQR
ncbi:MULTISPECIES: hypothetical protein [unclassified Streptomyces]|uniref:hypothetical protein n=1 Tax=unclassified Streptomyces TaxID=2593676 RepID=UPI0021561ABE|nr:MULTISPECIES: hypothetical protein [unclassified Streptomyces]